MDPDRELDSPETEPEICELCSAVIPVDSISWCYCNDCFEERVEERHRNERNKTLIGIGRCVA